MIFNIIEIAKRFIASKNMINKCQSNEYVVMVLTLGRKGEVGFEPLPRTNKNNQQTIKYRVFIHLCTFLYILQFYFVSMFLGSK